MGRSLPQTLCFPINGLLPSRRSYKNVDGQQLFADSSINIGFMRGKDSSLLSRTMAHATDALESEKAEAIEIDEIIQVGQVQQDMSERVKEENALVRRVDLFLMPALWFMYLFSYADRTK